MSHAMITRRAFGAAFVLPALSSVTPPWIALFDGKTLNGWTASENKGSWTVSDGCLVANGPRSHLFYDGPVQGAVFHNFELELEAMAMPGANSGVYFHTGYQAQGFPRKGFEVQVNNTATGEGNYRERKRTGSLYGIRNVYKTIVPDEQWFKMQIAVRGKNVQVRINGIQTVDYTEPNIPYIPEGTETERFLDNGTFALQCHDPRSKAMYRAIRVRPLPDSIATARTTLPVVDPTFRDLIDIGRANVPLMDYDIQLGGAMTLNAVLAAARRDGLQRSVCGDFVDDASAQRFIASVKATPAFAGLKPADRDWTKRLSRETIKNFDYVLADASTWAPSESSEGEKFVEDVAQRTVSVMNAEPVDICSNVFALPESLERDREILWTPARLRAVLAAFQKNQVALLIGDGRGKPDGRVINMAKEMGVRFVLGSGTKGAPAAPVAAPQVRKKAAKSKKAAAKASPAPAPLNLSRCTDGLSVIKDHKLTTANFWLPGGWGPNAAARKT